MRAAIFDMDGVLVDNTAFHFRAWQQVLQSYGVSLTMRQYVERLGGKTPEESNDSE